MNLEYLLRDIERSFNEDGWDQPPSAAAYRVRKGMKPRLLKLFSLSGKGYEQIAAYVRDNGPIDCDLLVFVSEAWAFPDALMEHAMQEMDVRGRSMDAVLLRMQQVYGLPSEHPQRVERRYVNALTRTGEGVIVTRRRDTNTVEVLGGDDVKWGGPQWHALRFAMGLEEGQ